MVSYHMIWENIIQIHAIFYHIIWYHIIGYDIISYGIVLCDIISCHMIYCDIITYDITWYHNIWYHIIWYDMKSNGMIWQDEIHLSDMFWTCSKKVWRVKNENFPRSFGDLWDMFWHHPWCLRGGLKIKKVEYIFITCFSEALESYLKSLAPKIKFIALFSHRFMHFLFFHICYIFPFYRAPNGPYYHFLILGVVGPRKGAPRSPLPYLLSYQPIFSITLASLCSKSWVGWTCQTCGGANWCKRSCQCLARKQTNRKQITNTHHINIYI